MDKSLEVVPRLPAVVSYLQPAKGHILKFQDALSHALDEGRVVKKWFKTVDAASRDSRLKQSPSTIRVKRPGTHAPTMWGQESFSLDGCKNETCESYWVFLRLEQTLGMALQSLMSDNSSFADDDVAHTISAVSDYLRWDAMIDLTLADHLIAERSYGTSGIRSVLRTPPEAFELRGRVLHVIDCLALIYRYNLKNEATARLHHTHGATQQFIEAAEMFKSYAETWAEFERNARAEQPVRPRRKILRLLLGE